MVSRTFARSLPPARSLRRHRPSCGRDSGVSFSFRTGSPTRGIGGACDSVAATAIRGRHKPPTTFTDDPHAFTCHLPTRQPHQHPTHPLACRRWQTGRGSSARTDRPNSPIDTERNILSVFEAMRGNGETDMSNARAAARIRIRRAAKVRGSSQSRSFTSSTSEHHQMPSLPTPQAPPPAHTPSRRRTRCATRT